jgi:hypothetical protein
VSGNRILFLIVVAILVVLVAAMVILATGSTEGGEGLSSLVLMLVGIGVVLLVIRLVREALRRR